MELAAHRDLTATRSRVERTAILSSPGKLALLTRPFSPGKPVLSVSFPLCFHFLSQDPQTCLVRNTFLSDICKKEMPLMHSISSFNAIS